MSPALLAYPLLLLAIAGVYWVGRRAERARGSFAWTRLVTLCTLFGLQAFVQVRLIMSGYLQSWPALAAASLSIAAVMGLVGLHVIAMVDDARAHRHGAPQAFAEP